jgi:acetyltransferase-like isoleucine patch superfamily enzyme
MTETRFEPKHLPIWQRLRAAFDAEVVGIHPRLHAYNLVSKLLPLRAHGEFRADLLRRFGFQVGARTQVLGPIKISGPRSLLARLSIGADCSIDIDCVFDASDQLTIGDRVTLEPGVMILTSTHELDFPKHRAGKLILNPVVVGDGVWLRSRCVLLPGVRIGAGAVVDVGAVVNKDVEPNTRVSGIPAAKVETFAGD